jgi:hypothetical protein
MAFNYHTLYICIIYIGLYDHFILHYVDIFQQVNYQQKAMSLALGLCFWK